jgi:enoyl-CoA hydratase/carnithine racemase
VLASVHGYALAGALELMMCCDLAIVADTAKFGEPEVRHNSGPPTLMMPWLLASRDARWLMYTGDLVDAQEALRMHLVNKVVPAAELMNVAREMMKTILANGPLAVALCIEAIDRGLEMSLDEGLILEANHFGLLAATDDMREGTRAFMEKRAPAFKGK